jgi:hypothetical protein
MLGMRVPSSGGNRSVKMVVTWLHSWHLSSSGNEMLVSFFGDLKYYLDNGCKIQKNLSET